jgi:hypothetical protein
MMYVLIAKERCKQSDVLKILLDEKEIQYHYLEVLEMPHRTMTYLKMYCRSYPMGLNVNCFSAFNETIEQSDKVL